MSSLKQRQKTALLFRNAGIAQSVNVVNASLLAFVNYSPGTSARAAFGGWLLVVTIPIAPYLLARRFKATEPNAFAAVKWRRRDIAGTGNNGCRMGRGQRAVHLECA